jgi:hypothetical protein
MRRIVGLFCLALWASPLALAADLGAVKSIDVEGFTRYYAPDFGRIDSELYEFTRIGLRSSTVLPYKSPAEAVIQYTCEDSNCNQLKVSLLKDKEALWSREISLLTPRSAKTFWLRQPKDTRQVSRDVIEQLERDFQKAHESKP